MATITIHPKSEEQADLFEQLAKVLKVTFEKDSASESPYNPEFIAKIKRGEKAAKEGKGTVITHKDLKNLWK